MDELAALNALELRAQIFDFENRRVCHAAAFPSLTTGQATRTPLSGAGDIDGRVLLHAATAKAQRGAKAQPLIGAASAGGIPGRPRNSDPMGSSRLGIALMRPIV